MYRYIGIASVVSILAALTVAFFPKVKKEVPVVLLVLLVASLVSEVASGVVFYVLELKVYWIANVDSIVQYTLIALLYYRTYLVSVSHRRIIVIGSFFFLVAAFAKTVVDPIYDTYYIGPWLVGGVLIVIYAIIYLNGVFSKTPVENIVTYGQFWINAAMFYYFMLNVFFYFLADKILSQPLENSDLLLVFHSLNNLVKNILLALGIYYLAKPPKEQIVYTSIIKVDDS